MKRIFATLTLATIAFIGARSQNTTGEFICGHVNLEEVMQLTDDMDQALETLYAAQQNAQQTYQDMMKELQGKYAEYEKNKTVWTQTPSILKAKEKELQDLQTRIEEFGNSIQQELTEQEQSLMAPIREKVSEAIKVIAKQQNLVYVFYKLSVAYVDESRSMDITPMVRKQLGIPADRTLESVMAARQAKYGQAAQQ